MTRGGYRGWRKARAWAAATALAAGTAFPTQGAPLTDWGAAVASAWSRHPQSAGWPERGRESAAAREAASAGAPDPASVTLGVRDDRVGSGRGRQEWEVEFAVPLWLPGQRDARIAEADSRSDETAARAALARWDVAGEVREAWWSLALARSAESLAARRAETAGALEADVTRRFRAGDVSRIDANLASSERLAAQSELADARLGVRQAEEAWTLLTGEAPAAELGEETARASLPVPDAGAIVGRHPQVLAAAAVARTARARAAVAERNRRAAPELALRVVRERGEASEPFGNSVGVKLTIPLSSAAQVRRETSAAAVDVEAAEAELRKTALRVAADIARAQWALDTVGRQIVAAGERRALAQDSLRLAEKAYALGESDLATLLRLRAAAQDAENQFERTRVARSAAISRFNQAAGALP